MCLDFNNRNWTVWVNAIILLYPAETLWDSGSLPSLSLSLLRGQCYVSGAGGGQVRGGCPIHSLGKHWAASVAVASHPAQGSADISFVFTTTWKSRWYKSYLEYSWMTSYVTRNLSLDCCKKWENIYDPARTKLNFYRNVKAKVF